jgi:hypothetical protein
LLLVIKEHFPNEYKRIPQDSKAAVLCSALKNIRCMNDWGYLHPSKGVDKGPAEALLATGDSAKTGLIALLDDESEAPLIGSEAATLSQKYGFRRKDFAYRYLSLLLGDMPRFDVDVKNRDKEIEKLKAKFVQ